MSRCNFAAYSVALREISCAVESVTARENVNTLTAKQPQVVAAVQVCDASKVERLSTACYQIPYITVCPITVAPGVGPGKCAGKKDNNIPG
jgi:hypothetical protein